MKKQTAGRDALGTFAPEFARLNDDVLFGEEWSRTSALSLRDRSLITLTSLLSQGLTDSSFKYHLEQAKKNGITRQEIAEVITHLAFYAGWPKAWSAFRLAQEVWTTDEPVASDRETFANTMLFPLGEENKAYARYFTGPSYLHPLSTTQEGIFNVTFAPGVRNAWHAHEAIKGGGQILIAIAGIGIYQEQGKQARLLRPGDVVNIPAGVVHFHGAAPSSWFAHLALEVPGEHGATKWLDAVSDEEYQAAVSAAKGEES